MTYMWSATAFCYYMMMFQIKYLPGDIFENSIASGVTEPIIVMMAGPLY